MTRSDRPRRRPSRRSGVLCERLEGRRMLAVELVKDINPLLTSLVVPKELTDVGGSMFFFVAYKLWKSDGTDAGTMKLGDELFFNPTNLSDVNGKLFFNEGSELWKNDGTVGGTSRVAPGVTMNPRTIVGIGTRAFFRGSDGGGDELWTSDGTPAGTVRLKDINPGASGSDPRELTNVNGRLFFRARDAAGGDELWTSDGTAAGTVRVKDINPGAASSEPVSLTNVNGTLYFAAHDADDSGYELWKSDGTEAGTVRIKDIRPGKPGSSPSSLRNVNGALMFVATDGVSGYELWKSDGTDAGTVMVRDLIVGGGGAGIDQVFAAGGALYFTADDRTGSGIELWKSDGTAGGTVRVKDIAAGAGSSNPGDFVAMGGQVYFVATDGATGYQVYRSDGTAAGTSKLGGPSRSYAYKLRVSGSKLFFISDGDGYSGTLWTSDGTDAGTQQRPMSYVMGIGSNMGPIVQVGSLMYFIAQNDTYGREIWKSDGTEAGTSLLVDLYPGWGSSYPSELINVNGTLFFVSGGKLWKSDGTAGGTVAVSNTVMSPTKLKVSGATLYFVGSDSGGQELWKSDGSAAGTVRVADIRVGGSSSSIDLLTDVNGTIYFIADDGTTGLELWKSDGTAAGTVLVKDVLAGATSSGPLLLTNAGGTLFFRANDGVNGWELWKSDGTAAGTQMVKDLRAGAASSSIRSITAVGNSVFFIADDGVHGQEIWKSDGTAAGTVLTRDIMSGAIGSSPTNLTEASGKLFFRADDGVSGPEVWISDGTTAGTQLVKEIRTGATGSDPMRFASVAGRVAFIASDGASTQIWVSDGTADGTFQLFDNTDAHYPSSLMGFGGYLYFSSYSFYTGPELRRLAMPASAPISAAAPAGVSAAPEAQPVAPLAPPPALLGDGDIFYDTLGFSLKPQAIASSGLAPMQLFGSGFYTDWDNIAVDEVKIRAIARQAAAANVPLVLDIEHWLIDSRHVSEGVLQGNLEKLLQVADWVHDERPGLKLGFYGLMPADAYPVPSPGVGPWHAATERIRPLIDKVDELYGTLYAFNPWQTDIWRTGAENMIAEARLYGKPIRPFYWPQYHFNPDQDGRLHSAEFWRMELDTAHDLADGALLWGGGAWKDGTAWWTVTRDFLIDDTPLAPAAPTALNAVPATAARINLAWTDNAYNETGWRIERRLGGAGQFVPVATLAASTTTYSDQSVSASSSYTYRVVAFNDASDSLASNEASATTPAGNIAPAAPVGPSASAISTSAIRINWLRGSQNETGFKIERSQGGGSFTQIGTAAAGATEFLDTNAFADVIYTYRVRAYNAYGNSAYSAAVTGITLSSTKDPRGLWRLDDAAGAAATDHSGAGRTGTLSGGPVWSAGTLGGAIAFDGIDDRVTVADDAGIRFAQNQDFTLSAWVNLTSLPGSRRAIVAKASGSGAHFGIWLDATNHWGAGGAAGDLAGPVASTGWTHVAVVQDGSAATRKLYVNGVEVASGVAQAADGAGDLWIGAAQAAGEHFAGTIDDVRLYGKTWSPAEIDALAHPRVNLNGTSGNDTVAVSIDHATDTYQFIVNGSTIGSALRDAIASVEINTGAGNDQVNIDFAGGDPLPAYGVSFDGGADADTLRIAGNRPELALDLDAGSVSRGAASITHTNIEALTLAAAPFTVTSPMAVSYSVALEAGASLDVADHAVAFNYSGASPLGGWNGSAYAGIIGAVAAGRNGGAWNGSGIVTRAAEALSPLLRKTIVPVEASNYLDLSGAQTALWNGMTVDATTVLFVYTWAGDADLNGVVDGDDYFWIDSGVMTQPKAYELGDFDYNGHIDADDYFLIDANYQASNFEALSSAPAAAASPAVSAANYFAPKAVSFANSPITSAYDRLLANDADDVLVL